MYKVLHGQTFGTYETKVLLGKEYLVVPVVAMIEGVRFGANQTAGELGLAEEFGKFAAGWNTSPVVLSHPQIDGNFVSAGEPGVLEDYYIGKVFHTNLDGKKLRMEAWLDTEVKDKNDEFAAIFARIEAGEIIEVSVGFFTEVEEYSGEFNAQKYTGVWRNIVPDHLAFLKAGEIGACSIADGCGSPRVNSTKRTNMLITASNTRKADDLMKGKKKTSTYNIADANCLCGGTNVETCACSKPVILSLNAMNAVKDTSTQVVLGHRDVLALQAFIAQSIPSDLLSSDIIRALADKLFDIYTWAFMIGYTSEYVVYEAAHEGHEWQLYRQSFSINSAGEVSFTSEPERIRLISKIVGVNDASTDTNINGNQSKESSMSTQIKFKPQQEGEKLSTEVSEGTEVATASTEVLTEVAKTSEIDAGVSKTQIASHFLTIQEYIDAAPAEMREVLQSSVKLHNQQKATLIANLKSTGRCKLSDDFLKAQTLEALEQFAALADVPVYIGAAAPVCTQSIENTAVPPAPKVFIKKTLA